MTQENEVKNEDGFKPSAPVSCSTALLSLQEAISDYIFGVNSLIDAPKGPWGLSRGHQLVKLMNSLQQALKDSKRS